MRNFASLALAAVVLLGAQGASFADQGMKVEWATSFEAARAKAAESGRPILYFQLLGRLDEEYC